MNKEYLKLMRDLRRAIWKEAWNAAINAAAEKVDDYDSYYSDKSAGDEVRELLKKC